MRKSRLRIANAVVSALMLVLFVLHGMGNSLQLAGAGSPVPKVLGYALLALCAVHAVLGCVLTVQTLRVRRLEGVRYQGLNRRFWAVRISGLALAVLIAFHAAVFWPRADSSGALRLSPFAELELAANALLVVALAVHVLAAMEPLLIDLGLPATRMRAADIAFALAIALALMLVAFVVYYLRWGVV